jgi:hypothetical protein
VAADWVGNLVTGAVGIAGVAGTYWTGRASRDAAVAQAREQREHALQDRLYAERREAYVGYLEAVQGARHALTQIRGLPTSPENGTEANELRAAALAEVSLRRTQLRLAGPPRVRDFANQLHGHLADVLGKAARGEENAVNTRLIDALLAAMKEDLGFELASADRQVLGDIRG